MKKGLMRIFILLTLSLSLLLTACTELIPDDILELLDIDQTTSSDLADSGSELTSVSDIPAYQGNPYIAVNGNVPFFVPSEIRNASKSYESYSQLDDLGRCGPAIASVGKDIMPTEERGSIGSVKPSGWQTVKYDFVDGNYLYNRCHLIGYQLTGENANNMNLITGTRYLNIEGMLEFENLVADYVKETNNHVLYRVTPVFNKTDLVALGVLMEGISVEDDGEGVCFCVFSYNVQPGVVINYADGTSRLAEGGEELMTMWNQETEAPDTSTEEPVTTAAPLVITSITEQVLLGETATISVCGIANTEYSITVTLPSGNKSSSSALVAKTSDSEGNVTWSWKISSSTKPGEGKIVVTGGGETVNATFLIVESTSASE